MRPRLLSWKRWSCCLHNWDGVGRERFADGCVLWRLGFVSFGWHTARHDPDMLDDYSVWFKEEDA